MLKSALRRSSFRKAGTDTREEAVLPAHQHTVDLRDTSACRRVVGRLGDEIQEAGLSQRPKLPVQVLTREVEQVSILILHGHHLCIGQNRARPGRKVIEGRCLDVLHVSWLDPELDRIACRIDAILSNQLKESVSPIVFGLREHAIHRADAAPARDPGDQQVRVGPGERDMLRLAARARLPRKPQELDGNVSHRLTGQVGQMQIQSAGRHGDLLDGASMSCTSPGLTQNSTASLAVLTRSSRIS